MFADPNDQSNPWNWPRYNLPGLLIGPLPYIKPRNYWVPDFSHPGVRERIEIEVTYVEDMAYDKGKL